MAKADPNNIYFTSKKSKYFVAMTGITFLGDNLVRQIVYDAFKKKIQSTTINDSLYLEISSLIQYLTQKKLQEHILKIKNKFKSINDKKFNDLIKTL